MSNDFLDQLAAIDAPEPPPEFDRKLHQRLNRALLVQHLFGLAAGSVPWAAFHFLRAVLGAAAFSVTGRFDQPDRGKNKKEDSP